MFCPKCGNQLSEGAQFCSSCGSKMNVQPVAPAMPAEPTIPTEPVVSAAPIFTPEQPVVNEVPVAPVFTPEQPVMNEVPVAPVFAPEQPVMNNMAIPATPDFNAATAPAKKSKTPLFIGLGIGALLIAIITIVIILIVTSGDDDDNKKPASATANQTTSDNKSTEEQTTERPSMSINNDIDFDDATDVAVDMIYTLSMMEYEDCVDYLYPGLASFIENNTNDDAAEYLDDYSWLFYTPDGDFFDYEVKDAVEENGDYFEEYDLHSALSEYDEYVKPSAFAKVEVEFTYETQTSSIYLILGYTNGQFYVLDFDDSQFNITTEEESTSEIETTTDSAATTEEKIQQMLNDNYIPLSGGEYNGSIVNTGDGYSIKVPSDWIEQIYEANNLTYYLSPDYQTQVNVVYDPSYGTVEPVTFLASMYNIYLTKNVSDVQFGTLTSPNADGYFSRYTYSDNNGDIIYGFQYIFTKEGDTNCYVVTVETYDPYSETFTTANYVAASLTIN